MQLELILKVFVLLAVANGAPVLTKKLMGESLSFPLDAGSLFVDGRPLLGRSKTVRGIVVAVIAGTLCAPLLGFTWTTGLVAGTAAMLGDLLSSFVKRRLGLAPSSRAFGLDQIPKSLLPALACMQAVGLTPADVAVVTALFTVGGQALSLLLYKLSLRDHPY